MMYVNGEDTGQGASLDRRKLPNLQKKPVRVRRAKSGERVRWWGTSYVNHDGVVTLFLAFRLKRDASKSARYWKDAVFPLVEVRKTRRAA